MRNLSAKFSVLALVAVIAFLCAAQVEAQDINLPPTYGEASLDCGFVPDPHVVNVTAGGNIRTDVGGVGANVANAPDFRLFYNAGSLPLTIYVVSSADTTLHINLPNGTWVANDDTNGLNPQIRLSQPMSGRYDIYVGTFGTDLAPAVLFITELR